MSKIVVFTDLHAHTFGPYSTALEDGTNSRLQDALNVIDKVREIALEEAGFEGDWVNPFKRKPIWSSSGATFFTSGGT